MPLAQLNLAIHSDSVIKATAIVANLICLPLAITFAAKGDTGETLYCLDVMYQTSKVMSCNKKMVVIICSNPKPNII